MSKYRQEEGTADKQSWNRASHMTLWNEDNPRVEIHHEKRMQYSDGQTVNQYLGQLSHVMTDPTAEIPFIDPGTYEQIEQTFTAGQFALMAASVYVWLAEQELSSQPPVLPDERPQPAG